MDQPRNALDMITRFTRGEPLAPPSAAAAGHAVSRKAPTRLLPGATWQLRRALPGRDASLSVDSAEA